MTLEDVLSKFTNTDFLLTVDGLCDEWYDGISELEKTEYLDIYEKYRDREVKSFALLCTNMEPELIIRLV